VRKAAVATFLASAVLVPSCACAADVAAPTPISVASGSLCDFYEDQLIGALCEHSGYAGFQVESDQLSVRHDSGPPVNFTSSDESNWILSTGALSITPLSWLKFTASSEYSNLTETYSYAFLNPLLPEFGGSKSSLNSLAWQDFTAVASVYAGKVGQGRYELNLFLNLGVLPGSAEYSQRIEESVGVEAGAHWALPSADYSLNFYGSASIQNYDHPNALILGSSGRLLLSNDAWGLALGPAANVAGFLARQGGFPPTAQSVYAGAAALLEPFRQTRIPILQDVTFEADALHSLGQADYVASALGNASEVQYSGSVRVNFRF